MLHINRTADYVVLWKSHKRAEWAAVGLDHQAAELRQQLTGGDPRNFTPAAVMAAPPPAELAAELAATIPSPAELAAELAATIPSPAELAAELAATIPSPAELLAEMTATSPSPAELLAELAATSPSPAELLAELAAALPSPAELAVEIAAAGPLPADIADIAAADETAAALEILEAESRRMWQLHAELGAELSQIAGLLTAAQRQAAEKALQQWAETGANA